MINRTLIFWASLLFLFGWFLYAVQPILLPFILGMLVAYLLDPAADKLEARGFSRTSATLVICTLFFLLFGAFFAWFIPAITQQLLNFIDDLPNIIRSVREWADPYLQDISARLYEVNGEIQKEETLKAVAGNADTVKQSAQDGAKGMFGAVGKFLKGLLESTGAIINLVSMLLITPITSFYLLRDWDRMVAKINDYLPCQYAETIREQVEKIDHVISGFVRGTFNVALILAAFYMIALSFTGLDYALIIGLVGGFAIIIPYIGTVCSGLLAVGMAIAQFNDMDPILIVAGIFVVGQVLEGNFLTPKLVGDKVGLHPVWVIFGLLAGGTLLGFVGVLLAVPITAAIGVLVRFGLDRYKESDYYKGEPKKALAKKTK